MTRARDKTLAFVKIILFDSYYRSAATAFKDRTTERDQFAVLAGSRNRVE